jgi:hypothetical protein
MIGDFAEPEERLYEFGSVGSLCHSELGQASHGLHGPFGIAHFDLATGRGHSRRDYVRLDITFGHPREEANGLLVQVQVFVQQTQVQQRAGSCCVVLAGDGVAP